MDNLRPVPRRFLFFLLFQDAGHRHPISADFNPFLFSSFSPSLSSARQSWKIDANDSDMSSSLYPRRQVGIDRGIRSASPSDPAGRRLLLHRENIFFSAFNRMMKWTGPAVKNKGRRERVCTMKEEDVGQKRQTTCWRTTASSTKEKRERERQETWCLAVASLFMSRPMLFLHNTYGRSTAAAYAICSAQPCPANERRRRRWKYRGNLFFF